MPPGSSSVKRLDDTIEGIIKSFLYPVVESNRIVERCPCRSLQFLWAPYGERAEKESFELDVAPFCDVNKDFPQEINLFAPGFVLLTIEWFPDSNIEEYLRRYIGEICANSDFRNVRSNYLSIDLKAHFEFETFWLRSKRISRYTIFLPPATSKQITFLQLFEVEYYDDERVLSGSTSNEEETHTRSSIAGLCFGVDRHLVEAALGLYPFQLGGEESPSVPRNAEEMMVSLLSLVSRAKAWQAQEYKHSFNDLNAKLDAENIEHDGLKSLNKDVGRLRDTLKSILGDLDELVRMTKEYIEKHLRKRNGDPQDDPQEGSQDGPQESAKPRPEPPGKKEVIFYEKPEPRPKRPEQEESIFQEIREFMVKLANSQMVARDETYHLLQNSRDLRDKVLELKQDEKDDLQAMLVDLTNALKADSANMKILAILSAFFLQFTFMAILLTTPMFKWPDPSEGEIIMWLPFRIYWISSGSMTFLLGLCSVGYYAYQRREKAKKKHKSGG